MAQQIFGGVGFTLEYEIQLYFRRAKQLSALLERHPSLRGAHRRSGAGLSPGPEPAGPAGLGRVRP